MKRRRNQQVLSLSPLSRLQLKGPQLFQGCTVRSFKGRQSARPRTQRLPALTPDRNEADTRAELLDDLALFQEWRATVLPQLRAAVESGKSMEEIIDLGHPALVARLISIGLFEEDSGKALSAIKEALDRKHGKTTDKKEITHKLDKLPDEELDALVLTKLNDVTESAD